MSNKKVFYMKRKVFCMFCSFAFLFFFVSAESKGEKLFKENNPEEASIALESELRSGKSSAVSYNYLGLSYYQLGEYEKSIEIFAKGLKIPGTNKKILAFNQGNSFYALREYSDAVDCYSLAIKLDENFDVAYLNRANAYLMNSELDKCIADYEKYLELKPEDSQKEKILALIDALRKKMERIAEEERIMAEQLEREAIENTPVWEQVVFDDEDIKIEEDELPLVPEMFTDNIDSEIPGKNQNEKNWEEVNLDKAEPVSENNNKKNWEEINPDKTEPVAQRNDKKDWEQVDPVPVSEEKQKVVNEPVKPEWEEIKEKNKLELVQNAEPYVETEEMIEHEKLDELVSETKLVSKQEELVEEEKWETLSSEEMNEILLLDEKDSENYNLMLEEKKKREEEQKNAEKENRLKDDPSERLLRLEEERLRLEEERRRKLLENVEKSLNSKDSSNITNGSEDILDYDQTSELD